MEVEGDVICSTSASTSSSGGIKPSVANWRKADSNAVLKFLASSVIHSM